MTPVAVIVRLLMLVACAVPCTSTRMAVAATPPPGAPSQSAPIVPTEEEDTEREEQNAGKEKLRTHASPSQFRRASQSAPVNPLSGSAIRTVIPSSPSPADPFRNGLGTPFRC
jgi:hypothetical protein